MLSVWPFRSWRDVVLVVLVVVVVVVPSVWSKHFSGAQIKNRNFHKIHDSSLKFDFLGKQIFQVSIALLMGSVIGFERRLAKSHKNLTYVVICTAACLIAVVSKSTPYIMGPFENKIDPTRVSASIISGVGFLGAGFILKGKDKVNGMTSAAMIWASAGLGMAIAFDYFVLATYTCFLLLFILNIRNLITLIIVIINKARGGKKDGSDQQAETRTRSLSSIDSKATPLIPVHAVGDGPLNAPVGFVE